MEAEKKNESSLWKNIIEWVGTIVVVLILSLVINLFVVTSYTVEGKSMVPTLENSDKLLVDKLSYKLSKPHRFEVIVFQSEGPDMYVKRIIGVPGDTIEVKDDILYINGIDYNEPYLDELKKQIVVGNLTDDFSLSSVTGKIEVPANEYFVMGDNRQNSMDSRAFGTIKADSIVGKTRLIYWPFKDFRTNFIR